MDLGRRGRLQIKIAQNHNTHIVLIVIAYMGPLMQQGPALPNPACTVHGKVIAYVRPAAAGGRGIGMKSADKFQMFRRKALIIECPGLRKAAVMNSHTLNKSHWRHSRGWGRAGKSRPGQNGQCSHGQARNMWMRQAWEDGLINC